MAKIDQDLQHNFQNNKQRFIANLIYTSNWFQNEVVTYLKPYEISFQQFNILRILRGSGEWMTMNDVKTLMIEKSPNTTRLVDKLIKKGFVERERSEKDRRVVFVMITDKGKELLKTIDDNPGTYLEFMDKMTDEEAKLVSEILERIRS